ncbi:MULTISPECIES: ribokinase [Lawsonibacter]|uniref:Ribokinase n=1 Tax=Lawsonibacter hominis TaxID=2763053 RepID=A0A8J6JEA8_9FIRM|nr:MULTISPECIES: ribokinase [Lawsonibacter]MBS1383098.1 ribokinase [Flavonifractor sp.]MDU2194544.1 ribokinase [Clostridiales bacterium]MDY2977997.1 ribokinase [Oscillospiraceae bacterium]MBC5733079.1 ribokinase [Lawsonibacter hominis]MCI6399016.1 ribokinase [Lawsonibacter sp.]
MGKKPNILVVGSFVMDLIVSTQRLPENGETVLGTGFRTAPGGKGLNQAVQAARLGAQVEMMGCVGRDAYGDTMLACAREAGVDVSHVKRTDQAPSAIGNVQLFQRSDGSTQNRIVVVPGANLLLTQADVAFLREKIGGFDMVMLQLEIPLPVNIAVARYARAAGVPVMLNPAPAAPLPADLLSAVTYLSPNENEAELLSGVPLHRTEHGIDLKRVEHAAAVLRDKGAAHVIVTLGDVGSAYLGKEFLHCPSVSGIQAIDPTAAGDSYIGALSVALAGGEPVDEAMRRATHTAAITVSRMGALPSLPTLAEVEVSLARRSVS